VSHNKSDQEFVAKTHNTARFFTEQRHVAWILLIGVVMWGVFGFMKMPKSKDPVVPVGIAAAFCVWPGAPAERIEQLITKRIEAKIAENANVDRIESNTRNSVVVIFIYLKQNVVDTAKVFDDIALKLGTIRDLPQLSGPVQFIKDFGDTSTLLLTVASPKVDDIELELRAATIQRAIESVRAKVTTELPRVTIVSCFPSGVSATAVRRIATSIGPQFDELGLGSDMKVTSGPGFLGVDIATEHNDEEIIAQLNQLLLTKVKMAELHPDVWPLTVVRDPKDTLTQLKKVAGDRYTYRELDEFTDQIQRRLQTVPVVSKVTRTGVLPEMIYLHYSQERLASYGASIRGLDQVIGARNITFPGGVIEADGKNITINPSGEFKSEDEIGDLLIGASEGGAPVYLRDIVEIERSYQSPPQFLNELTTRDANGEFQRSRAITLSVQMRNGEQISEFRRTVDAALAGVSALLPEDLILKRVSDQPVQVDENTSLFMRSLYEAIVLVVLVAFVGFWEWRSALLMALSIPITLAMTFGMMVVLKLDIQQVSLATLIIALGLLVDDPVVAGDAIKRSLSEGWKPLVAAWLGPTKLATAIMFATVTNIVAYLPMLILTGDIGRFIYSLPVVLTCSLVASRIVSMAFIPLLGYYLLRAPKKKELPIEERREVGFARWYSGVARWAIENRLLVLILSLVPLVGGFSTAAFLKLSFFPKDHGYIAYIDVWLPEDAPLSSTRQICAQADRIIRRVTGEYEKEHGKDGKSREILDSITAFIGGGAPRFWFSVFPEQQQLNYAQLLVKVTDKDAKHELVPQLQYALASEIAGARLDVRELENGKAVNYPIAARISGEDIPRLREYAEKLKDIYRKIDVADRIRDDWGADSFSVQLRVDPDRANVANITNLDVALSSAAGMNGAPIGALREGDRQIPIVARLRAEERTQVGDIQNLYVYSFHGKEKVPLRQVSSISYSLETERIRRRNHYRTITVWCFAAEGHLPSEVMKIAGPKIEALAASLPPGYSLEIGGEQEEQEAAFSELGIVLVLSVIGIFLALVVQFRNAVKPLIVYAAIPYGVAGAVATLALFRMPFGFMAFLGIVSLIGVIVSHIIVLFDFIEERHAEGSNLEDALIDAGILRLRPVAITVGATVLGLVPLVLHGGPLWEPLCLAQIGGLTVATVLTLLLVPVLYAIFVLDLKLVKWDEAKDNGEDGEHGEHGPKRPHIVDAATEITAAPIPRRERE
jgi:multidrug efflux pump subunit AcrB